MIRLVAIAALTTLLAGCAPQLDRIELSVQESREEVATMQAESRRLRQEIASLAELMRLSADVGDENNAQRYATLSQVIGRLDQLTQKLDDNAAYMRDVSARVDMLATRVGVPTIGEFRPPAGRPGRPRRSAGGRAFHLPGRPARPQPRQHRPRPRGLHRVPRTLRRERAGGRRDVLARGSRLRRRELATCRGPIRGPARKAPADVVGTGGDAQKRLQLPEDAVTRSRRRRSSATSSKSTPTATKPPSPMRPSSGE